MFHQTFSLLDLPKVLLLVLLECALSADNALVIAAIIKPLPSKDRNKALWVGFISAIVLRIGAILSIAYFIHFFWVQILGAAYLLYLAIFYRLQHDVPRQITSSKKPLWKVIVRLECTDLIFAIDSIIAALAVTGITISSNSQLPSKIWIVYLGGILGLVLMRFAAKILAVLMDRFSNLEQASHYLIGWVAIKLGAQSIYEYSAESPSELVSLYMELSFWIIAIMIVIYGMTPKKSQK